MNNDIDRINEGRRNKLQDIPSENLQVSADLREQINEKLVDALIERGIAEKVYQTWHQGNADRTEWLKRNQEYLIQFDEFIDPIYDASTDWSSTLHFPTILTVCKTFHARMQSALLTVDPFFTAKARKEANVEQESIVQDLLRYTFKDWVNDYAGIDETFDRWLWDWCTFGCGILKARWTKRFTRFVDVESVTVPGPSAIQVDPATGAVQEIPTFKKQEREVKRTIKCFEGPMVDRMNLNDVLIVGGEGDPQNADMVIQQQYLVASDLWSLADQGIFKEDAVEEVIRSGEQKRTSDSSNAILQTQKSTAGMSMVDKNFELSRYHILEAYLKIDVDDSGINSDVVVWVHPETREILRATYLYRVSPSGKRPFVKIDFHKRNNNEYGVGLVELLYSLAKEIDAMHNIRIDVGIITALPWGFYRPTASMAEEKLPIEPGTMIPLDNPGQDVYFPNLGNRTSFGFQEEAALMNQIERLTSMSDLSLGIIGGQGATRTATGTQAVLGEANANLDVFLRRMNRGVKQLLVYMFGLLQQKCPEGLEFRLFGTDGKEYWRKINSREELYGMFDFELDANSANSNKQIQMQTADFIYQSLQNPMLLQTGIVNQGNLYEALKNAFQVRGIKDVSKYIQKPADYTHRYLPIEIANRVLAGQEVKLDPTQDLHGFVTLAQEFLSDDNLLGHLNQGQVRMLVDKMREAQQLVASMEQMAAQQRNQSQMMMNQQMAPPSQQMSGMGSGSSEPMIPPPQGPPPGSSIQ